MSVVVCHYHMTGYSIYANKEPTILQSFCISHNPAHEDLGFWHFSKTQWSLITPYMQSLHLRKFSPFNSKPAVCMHPRMSAMFLVMYILVPKIVRICYLFKFYTVASCLQNGGEAGCKCRW